MPKFFSTILVAIVLIFLVIALNIFGFELLSYSLELLIVPALALFYYFGKSKKGIGLTLFFVIYSLGDLINLLDFNAMSNWSYYVCNILYIIAYTALFYYVSKTVKFSLIIKEYAFDFIVLILLDIYMLYVLIKIVKPVNFESKYILAIQLVELFFSLILILLMSLSFLNYIQNTKKKYFLLFLGCLSLAFSELILIGYYYITDEILLSYVSTVLYVSGFIIIFYHSLINSTNAGNIER